MHTHDDHQQRRSRFSLRRFVSFLAALTFAVMLLSGAVVFIAPSGRIARDIGWTWLGLGRAEWESVHTAFAVLFLATAVIHLALNWRPFRGYLTDRVTHRPRWSRELAMGLALTGLLLATAIADWPPATLIKDANDYFRRDFWVDGPVAGQGIGRRGERASVPAPVAQPAQGGVLFDQYCGRCHTAAKLIDGLTAAGTLEMRAFLESHGDSDSADDAAIVEWLLDRAETVDRKAF